MLKTDKSSVHSANDTVHLEALYSVIGILSAIPANQDIGDGLARVLSVCMQAVGGRAGSLFIVDENKTLIRSWLFEDGKPMAVDDLFIKIILSEGLAGRVLQTKTPVIVPDTTQSGDWMPQRDHPSTSSAWSAICVPVLTQQRLHGVMTISTVGANQLGQHDQKLLMMIANQIATGSRQ